MAERVGEGFKHLAKYVGAVIAPDRGHVLRLMGWTFLYIVLLPFLSPFIAWSRFRGRPGPDLGVFWFVLGIFQLFWLILASFAFVLALTTRPVADITASAHKVSMLIRSDITPMRPAGGSASAQLFTDGSICDAYALLATNNERQYYRIPDLIAAPCPDDSRSVCAYAGVRAPDSAGDSHDTKVCISVVPGSRQGLPRSKSFGLLAGIPETPLLNVVSDLHIAEDTPLELQPDSDEWPAELPLPQTAERFQRILDAMDPAVPLAVCGDITDAGTAKEWALFHRLVPPREHVGTGVNPVILVPGNHDICLHPKLLPDKWLRYRREREQRFEQNSRRYRPSDERIGCPYEASSADSPVLVVVLDSNRYRSRHPLSNALGRIGRRQRHALQTMLAADDRPAVVFLHHHISASEHGEPTSRFQRLEARFMIALDSRPLLRTLRAYARRTRHAVLVIHGHRHQVFHERFGPAQSPEVVIYGHPSSTLGDKTDGGLDTRLRYATIGRRNGRWVVNTTIICDGEAC